MSPYARRRASLTRKIVQPTLSNHGDTMDPELVRYLDERFNRVDQRFDRVEQRLDAHDQRFEEVKRHSGVLVEGLRQELQLVAEGFAMHIQVQHVQERKYHDRQHQETRALIRSIYDELRQRVENLEQKRQN